MGRVGCGFRRGLRPACPAVRVSNGRSVVSGVPDWLTVGAMVGGLAPLVGVPLTMIAVYLRAIREAQDRHERINGQRFGTLESDVRRVAERLDQVERGCATKGEWLQDSLHTREQLERLVETTAEVRSRLESTDGIARRLSDATAAMVGLARAMVEALAADGAVKSPDVDRQDAA